MSMDANPQTNPLTGTHVKAVIFDLMGTCLDWYTSITPALQDALSASSSAPSKGTALRWRNAFFDEIHARFEAGLPHEDIDETHRRTLLAVLEEQGLAIKPEWVDYCVQAWHKQTVKALPALRSKFDVIVLANGTTRLQMDITKSAGLSFDALLSSELLALTKPDPAIYLKALDLLKVKPEECVMVAAHAYDLRAARKVGMRTVYIQRWTEDLKEFTETRGGKQGVREENDAFIDAREATSESGGLLELVQLLGA
ncbi:hypothetical protein Q7P37_003414 [Cladosporium fusiforme]